MARCDHSVCRGRADLAHRRDPRVSGRIDPAVRGGWDNQAFLVTRMVPGEALARREPMTEEWVFRFPRREVAAPLLVNELAVLPRIAPNLPLPIPVPTLRGGPTGSYPWVFAGYRKLAGHTACSLSLRDPSRARLARPLGLFLRALHSVPTTPLREIGLPGDELARLVLSHRLPQLEERVHVAHTKGLVTDPASILAAAHETARAHYIPRTDVLVHGDLYARHLLVDDSGDLSGVIDWGDIHAGDAAQDLGLVVGFLPPSARREFVRAYGAVSEDAWAFARLRALLLAVAILLYGDDTGDAALVHEGRTGLTYALS
ncbi:MAG: phosphotransferase [Candidatus Eisenbacteria bacterium]